MRIFDATSKDVKGETIELYREFFHRLDLANRDYPRCVTLTYSDFRELFGNCGLWMHPMMQDFNSEDRINCAFDSGIVTFRCSGGSHDD